MDLRGSLRGGRPLGLGIRPKLLAALVPLSVVSTVLLGVLAERAVSAVLVGRSAERAGAMAAGLAALPDVADGLGRGHEAALLRRLQAALAAGAAFALALDGEGRVVAHTDVREKGKRYAQAVPLEAPGAVGRLDTPAGPVVVAEAAVWAEAGGSEDEFLASGGRAPRRRVGAVRLALPLAADLETAAQMARRLWVLIAATNLAALGLLAAFLGRLLRPALRLAAAADRLGAGALGETVLVPSADELGRLAESFNKMSRDLARITVSRDALDAVLSNMPDAVIVADPAGRVRELNPAALRLLGGTPADWAGRPARELFGPALPEELVSAGFRDREAQLVTRSGEYVPVLAGLAVSSEAGGRSLIITATDLSELARTKAALEENVRQLARSNQELEEFAFVASHDLQEPLRRILTYAEMTVARNKERLDADSSRHLAFIADSARRLQLLIRALLDLSRAAHGELACETVDLASLADRILAERETGSGHGGGQVTRDALPKLTADRNLLEVLLRNLLDNALKFRGASAPQVHLSAREEGSQWVVSVRDNGIGIAAEHLDKVFQIFQRLHSRAQYPGTGIGLALCRKIAERHGGRIWAESEPGRGTTFRFSIPKRERAAAS